MRWLSLFGILVLIGCGADNTPAAPDPTSTPDNRGDALERFMRNNFRDTSWWRDVDSFNVDGRTVTVETALGNSAAANTVASSICAGVSSYIYANPNQSLGLERLRVLASSGQPLVVRNDTSDSC